MGIKPSTSSVVSKETADGINGVTILTLTSFPVGVIPDNASLGFGAALCSIQPTTATVVVKRVTLDVSLLSTVSNTAQTPVVGVGSTVASGAVSVLSGTTTFENYFAGQAVADVAGTRLLSSKVPGTVEVSSGAGHTMYLNTAAAWADVASTAAVAASGTVTIEWTQTR
jgi:alpha-ketoglutarate-dependent taurine dioxygenase